MLIKRFTAVFLIAAGVGLFAQTKVRPMTQEEFKYYEYQIRTGQLERYRKPSMDDKGWRDLMNDIISQIIESHVPDNMQDWKNRGSAKVPSRNQIRLLAHRMRALIENPELEEVSRQKLLWFKNIGNGFIVLENIQPQLIRAVLSGNGKVYKNLVYQYRMNVAKLKKLLDEREKWEYSRRELNQIRQKNTVARKKKADQQKQRYEITRKLLRDGKLKWEENQKNNKNTDRRKGPGR